MTHIYVLSMLSLGRILMSDLVVADLFMHSLSRYDSTLASYLAAILNQVQWPLADAHIVS